MTKSNNNNDRVGDSSVGYGRPPKHTRWKNGQSGNPAGRRKGARGLKSDLRDELASRMTIRINNEPVTDTKQRLMVKALTARAAAGDTRAAEKLIDVIARIIGVEDENKAADRLSARDQDLLEQWIEYGASSSPAKSTEEET